jgi:hypothetical protein
MLEEVRIAQIRIGRVARQLANGKWQMANGRLSPRRCSVQRFSGGQWPDLDDSQWSLRRPLGFQ